jgi:hypothetical protein
MLDFLLSFLFKAVFSVNTEHSQPQIKNEVTCDAHYLSFDVLKKTLCNIEVRRDLFKNGKETAAQFIEQCLKTE